MKGIAIGCVDGRLPAVGGVLFLGQMDEVTDVFLGATVPSPEVSILNFDDSTRLDGIISNIKGIIELHPDEDYVIGVFGHKDCRANPQEKAAQVRQISQATDRLRAVLGADGLQGYRGKILVIGCYQERDTVHDNFPVGKTEVVNNSGVPLDFSA